MPAFNNLTGKKFGKWTVLERVENSNSKQTRWLCQCDCGEKGIVHADSLKNGRSASCGCLKAQKLSLRAKTHGQSNTPEFTSWVSMLSRCYNPNRDVYPYYGGRGITVCDRWKDSFENFYTDMGPRPEKNFSIDRINPDGNYEPSNCRWATTVEQHRNQRVQTRSSTKIRGVNLRDSGKYQVTISLNGKTKVLGQANTLEEAKVIRQKGELEYWGQVLTT